MWGDLKPTARLFDRGNNSAAETVTTFEGMFCNSSQTPITSNVDAGRARVDEVFAQRLFHEPIALNIRVNLTWPDGRQAEYITQQRPNFFGYDRGIGVLVLSVPGWRGLHDNRFSVCIAAGFGIGAHDPAYDIRHVRINVGIRE